MKKRKSLKMFSAIALGMILMSGGALAFQNFDPNQIQGAESLKLIKENPDNFLKASRVLPPVNFDYFEELNDKFSEKPFDITSDSVSGPFLDMYRENDLLRAIDDNDYEAWKKATQNLKKYFKETTPLDKESFDLLSELHKKREEFERRL